MSKIGKMPIQIPPKTDVSVVDGVVTVKGPLGSVSKKLHSLISVSVANDAVTVTPANTTKLARSLWGTFGSHIKNMVKGVNAKYEKKLSLEGIGYRVELSGKNLKFAIGFSHPVIIPIPQGIDVVVEKNLMTMTAVDKDALGQFAAMVRSQKPPEPYKGKGIRYVGEYVRQKQGKKAAAAGGAA